MSDRFDEKAQEIAWRSGFGDFLKLKEDIADALRAENAKANEWQPIEEMPKEGKFLIGCFGKEAYGQITTFWRGGLNSFGTAYTHWMPLPAPPARKAKA